MPSREIKSTMTINSEKLGLIEIEKTHVEILSEMAGTCGEVINQKLVNVVVCGNMTDKQRDDIAAWIFFPNSKIPDFI